MNQNQKASYLKMMLFVKRRGTNPLSEEKQILDGVKLVLDNNWTVCTSELVHFFALIGLHLKAQQLMSNDGFQEFIYALGTLFELEAGEL